MTSKKKEYRQLMSASLLRAFCRSDTLMKLRVSAELPVVCKQILNATWKELPAGKQQTV